jgi:hypothetical protein
MEEWKIGRLEAPPVPFKILKAVLDLEATNPRGTLLWDLRAIYKHNPTA